ncbi:hypothetical protein NC651_017502 [Populus alba x Populus x berolinensis]|nr:hypothetical protein NC651_017502 [Populus alba x Populus x berolinensis]
MSKNDKKRVAVNSHQSQFVNEGAINRVKYQNLLEDFLELQKRKITCMEDLVPKISSPVEDLVPGKSFIYAISRGSLFGKPLSE